MEFNMDKKFAQKISFLGAGNIAEAWIERLIASGFAAPEQLLAADIRPEPLEKLDRRWGIRTTGKNADAAGFGDFLVLAVPPPATLPVLQEAAPSLRAGQIVVSLAAAVPLEMLEQAAGGRPVVRVMPNTPALVGAAMNLVVFGSRVTGDERERLSPLLDVLGEWLEVPDEELDRWCALCAVGPTFLLPVIDALAAAAASLGLPPEKAVRAAAQMVAGTGQMVRDSGRTPEQLKQMIGLRTLDEDVARDLFSHAYDDAVQKLEALRLKMTSAALKV
jgi:pyrroline-5-carboxylate reductase